MSVDEKNPDLLLPVVKDSKLKKLIINYVGEQLAPEKDEINVEMVIKIMADEFPEILLAIAEENFIRGYQQAMWDIDNLDPDHVKENIS